MNSINFPQAGRAVGLKVEIAAPRKRVVLFYTFCNKNSTLGRTLLQRGSSASSSVINPVSNADEMISRAILNE